MANLFGTGINQIPTNGMLGNLAFQDKSFVSVDKIGIGTTAIDTGTANQTLQNYGGAYISGNLGIGSTNPTSTLSVQGNVFVSGVVTATTFSGTLSGYGSSAGISTYATNAGTSTSVIGGIASVTQLNVSGISTLQSTTLIGGGTTTGTASQPLQVTGGAYVSGSVGIGTTNPSSQLHITGQFQSTQANSTTTGGGQIYLNGATGNRIDFNQNGIGAPTFTTRSAGTKLVLYPSVGGSGVDYAVGMDSSTLWFSIETNSNRQFRWYAGTTNIATLFGTGELVLGTTSLTGTASQPLQVTGGAYVSGSVGIGTTNPTNRLTVYGTNNDTTPILALLSGNNSNAFNNGAQIAFGYNGTPTYQHFIQTRHNSGNLDNAIDFYVSDGTQNNTLTSGSVHTMSLVSGFVGIQTTAPLGPLQVGAATSTFIVTGIGSVGVGTTNPQYKLHVIGSFAATTKSFVIDHPTKEGMKLRHGSLEGPENGVYVRGRSQNDVINLPDYWTGLVDETSITVNLTPIGRNAPLHSVVEISNNTVEIESANGVIDCFYTVYAERVDVEKLEVEI